MRKRSRKALGMALLIFLAVVSAGCEKKKRAELEKLIPVKTGEVELKNLKSQLDHVGDIEAKDDASVYPKVSGKIIEKVKEDGSPVKKGDVIAYVDRDEVGFKFERAPVESPLDGVVGRTYVDIGTSVTPQTPVALVVDLDRVKIELDVPEKYLPRISLGQNAEAGVDAYPGEVFTGLVSKISPVLDRETRTAPVEIEFPNPGHLLKPGMFARVQLILKEQANTPMILKEAVLGKEPETYVYVLEGDVARQRKVKLGIRQGPYYEVTEGLKGGETIVLMGQQKLRDGARVIVEKEPGSGEGKTGEERLK